MKFSTIAGRRFLAGGLWLRSYCLFFHEWRVTLWVPQRVGCDNILGSDAVEDSCGVCKGNNSDCTTHKGLYAKHHRTNREYAGAAAGLRKGMEAGPSWWGELELQWKEQSPVQFYTVCFPAPKTLRFSIRLFWLEVVARLFELKWFLGIVKITITLL